MSFCVIFNFLILIFGCHRRTPPGQIASTVIHVLTSIRDADNARWSASLDTPLGLSSIHILPIVLWGWGAISQVERWRFVWSPKHWAASRQRTLHRHPSPGICWLLPFARWLNVMRGVNEWSCLAGEFPNCEYHHAHLQHEVWGAGKWGSLGVDPRALLFEFVSGIVFFSWNQKNWAIGFFLEVHLEVLTYGWTRTLNSTLLRTATAAFPLDTWFEYFSLSAIPSGILMYLFLW